MTNEEDPEAREKTRVAGASLTPTGTFPAGLHTLSDEVPDEPAVEVEPAALLAVRAERIWGLVPFLLVLVVAAAIALAATFATEITAYVFGISIAIAVAWWLVRGRR